MAFILVMRFRKIIPEKLVTLMSLYPTPTPRDLLSCLVMVV